MSSTIPRTAGPVLALGIAMIAACSPDVPTSVQDVSPDATLEHFGRGEVVCHRSGSPGELIVIPAAALPAHLAHGDYVALLHVGHDAEQPSDGAHFGSIGDALAAARTGRLARGELTSAACRITIDVAPGDYVGTTGPASGALEHFPMIVDVPDISLRGALSMVLDFRGRATGQGAGGVETTLSPLEPLPFVDLISTPIIIANVHPGGSAGSGLVVEGFVFRSGHDPEVDAGGQGILSVRAERVRINGNRFEGGFTESIDVRGGGANVTNNHLSGTAGTCDVCLAGPGRFAASGNRLLAGGIPGLGVSSAVGLPVPEGVEPLAIPASAETWADFRNNEVRDHQRLPVGTALRIDAIGVLAPDVNGRIHATFADNTLVNNRFGLIVHAAFPRPGTELKSDVDVEMHGNEFIESCQADLLVSFSRHTTALGLTSNPYLQASTFRLSLGGDLDWQDAWYGHPDGFGNTLIVDGQTIPNGIRQFYDPVGCPAQSD